MKELLTVIVPAAGAGKRMGLGKNKAFITIRDIPLLVLCMKMLAGTGMVRRVIVVTRAWEIQETEMMLREHQASCFPHIAWEVTSGGKERQDSVANGLARITDTEGYVAVHDGARPFAGKEVFARTFAKAKEYGAAIAAVPLKDTVKVVDDRGVIVSTPDRSSLCAVQTPQIFEVNVLRRGYDFLKEHPFAVTDDASLVEASGHSVAIAEGSYENIKVTTPEDLLLAERILEEQGDFMMQFRVGTGFDVHALVENRPLILAGVQIPYTKGLLGHSDADVALHALMDALLGAAGKGDIGKHFPDTDSKYEGADSRRLLRIVVEMLQKDGWKANNVDVTIIAQKPKLAPYIAAMRTLVAQDLGIMEDAVNIKATTTEKLGFAGRGEGIAAEAVASIIKG